MFLLCFVLTVNDFLRQSEVTTVQPITVYHMKVLTIVCAETPSSILEILLEEKK